MTDAVNAFGAEFWMAKDGQTLVKVANILSLKIPSKSRETLDATTHDSTDGVQEFISSGIVQISSGQITGHWVMGGTTETAGEEAVDDGDLYDFKVVGKGAAGVKKQRTFSGYVTGFEFDDQTTDGKQGFTLSFQPSGPMTPSANVA